MNLIIDNSIYWRVTRALCTADLQTAIRWEGISFCLDPGDRRIMGTLLHPFNSLFHDNQKDRTTLDFNEARDDWVAVASAGPYTNHLFAPRSRQITN